MNLNGYLYALKGAQQELEEAKKEFKEEEDLLHMRHETVLHQLQMDVFNIKNELRESGLCPHKEVTHFYLEDYHNGDDDDEYTCTCCGQVWQDTQPKGSVVVSK